MRFTHKSIEELLSHLKEQRASVERQIAALEAAPRNFSEKLIRAYIATRSTIKAAEFAKAQNVRSPKGTVFSSRDVTSVINSNTEEVHPGLLELAREIHEQNSRAVEEAFG